MYTKPLSILHLTTLLDPGGAENHLLTLCQGLHSLGHQVEVAYLLDGHNKLEPKFIQLGICTHGLRMRSRYDFTAMVRLVDLIRTNHYDIVHTHLIRSDLLGTLAAKIARNKTLISSKHNDDWFYHNAVVAQTERWLCKQSRQVIVISQALANFYQSNSLIHDETKLNRIHYGLDLKEFDHKLLKTQKKEIYQPLGIPEGAQIVLTVGRLEVQKGQHYLINAFPKIHAYSPNIHLIIVGQGSLHFQLENHIKKLGLSSHIHLLGWRPDVQSLMAASDIFVLPSLWEGFGLVLLEAMAAQCPVIASNISAIPEIVVHGKTGILVPPRDSDALAQAILDLLQNSEQRLSMGREGRLRVMTDFTVERMVDRTITVYKRCLS